MVLKELHALYRDIPRYWRETLHSFRAIGAWAIRNRIDLGIAAIIGCAMFSFILTLSYMLPDVLFMRELQATGWFDGDIWRVYETLTNLSANNHRTTLHPLQPLLTFPPVQVLRWAGMAELDAVLNAGALTAGVWASVFYSIFRGIKLPRLDAIIFTALGATSSASVFWFSIPESYGMGSLSVITVFAMLTITQHKQAPFFYQVLTNAFSFAITSSNWMAGILAALAVNSYRRAIRITAGGLVLVTGLFGFQQIFFPRSLFFMPHIRHELGFILHERAGTFFDKIRSFFAYGMVSPPIPFVENPYNPLWTRLTVQTVPLTSLSPVVLASIILWLGLFAYGWRASTASASNRAFVSALSLFFLFQLAFHLFYGDETFLYSLHIMPLMVLLTSFGALTKYRLPVLAAAGLLVCVVAYNNISSFMTVAEGLDALAVEVRKSINAQNGG